MRDRYLEFGTLVAEWHEQNAFHRERENGVVLSKQMVSPIVARLLFPYRYDFFTNRKYPCPIIDGLSEMTVPFSSSASILME